MSTNATVEEKAAAPARRTFHLRSIRTRLLVIFVLLVLLPAVIIGVIAAAGSYLSGRYQAANQLGSVATLKQGEIKNWAADLQLNLNIESVREQDTQRMLTLLRMAPDTADYQAAATALFNRFQQTIELRKIFEELFFMDAKGQVVLSSDTTQQGKVYDKQEFFVQGLKGRYIQPPFYSTSLGRMSVIVVQPVKDEQGQAVGVLAARANIARLSEIMTEVTGLGTTGETYLIGSNSALLTSVRSGEKIGYVHSMGSDLATGEDHVSGSDLYNNYKVTPVLGDYRWLPDLQIALVAEQAQSEAFAATYMTLGIIAGITMIAVVAAAAIGFVVTRGIANPLANLAETSARIAGGDLTARAQAIASGDEIGVLATSFNAMADRVGTLLTGLGERSRELEASQRVAVAASERVSPDELLDLVVNLVRDQFNLYHVQVYVVDEKQSAAVLRQSTGFAGRQLMQKGHKIPLDRPALVTQAIREGQPVLVDDVTRVAGFLANPLLPDTKSELVVPLKVGDKVIGVLDAQDRAPGRFGQSTVALFQTMANQISFLFENSQLLERTTAQTEALNLFTNQLRTAADIAHRLGAILDPERLLQQVVELMQSRFGLYHAHIYVLNEAADRLVIRAGSGEVGRVLRERGHNISLDAEKSLVARAARDRETVLVNDTTLESDFMPNPLLPQTRSEVALPLVVGDKVLGVLDVQDDQAGRFTQADLDTFATLAGQIATSLQNAGLFEAQKQAEQATRESEERQRQILDSMPVGTMVSRISDGTVLYANEGFGALFGKSATELVGQATPDLYYDPDDRAKMLAALHERGSLKDYELRGKRLDDGRMFFASVSIQPFVYGGEPVILAAFSDMTERLQAQAERERFTAQLSTAADVAGQVNSILDPDQLLTTIIPLLHDRFQLYHAHFYGLDAAAGELVLRAGYGEPGRIMLERGHKIPLDREHSLVARAARTKEAVLVNDVTSAPDFLPNPLLPETRSEVAVPAIAAGQVLGVFDVQQNVADYFTEADLDVFTTLTGQIATALQNASLFGQVGRNLEETRVRLDVSQALAPAQTEEEVLDAIMQHAGLYPQAQVTLFTFDPQAEEPTVILRRYDPFESEAAYGVPVGTRMPASRFPLLNLITRDEPFVTANVRTDERVDDATRELASHGSTATAIIPIAAGTEFLGVFAAVAKQEGYFDERKVHLYQTLAEQGAIALRTARLRDATREGEERFRSIVEHSHTGIFTLDNAFHFVYVNDRMAEIMGYSPEDLVGLDFRKVLTPESMALVSDYYVRRQKSEKVPDRYEITFIHKDGEQRSGELSAAVVRDTAGNVRTVGQLLDITERKQAQEALDMERNLLRSLIDNVPDYIYVKDRDSRFLMGNPAVAQMMGAATADELIGKNDFDFYPEELAAKYHADEQAIMQSGQPLLQHEEPVIDPTGNSGWLSTTKVPLRDAQGHVFGLVGMGRNITEQKRTAEAVRQSQQMLQLVMNNIPQSIFWKDRNLTYLGCNRNFADDAALATPDEIVGKNDYDMPWVDQAELYRADDSRVMDSGEPVLGYEEPQTTADGSQIWLRTSKVPLRDATGNVTAVLGMYEDITERKRAEKELADTRVLMESAFEQTPIPMVLASMPDMAIRIANSASREFLGVQDEPDSVGTPLLELKQSWQDLESDGTPLGAGELPLALALQGVTTRNKELRVRRKDGTERWELTNAGPIYNAAGELIAGFVAFPDITETKRAEQAVRESEEKFKALADNLAVGVFIHQDGIVRYMGQEGVRLLGYNSPADFIGRPIMDYVHPSERKRIAEIARQRPDGQSVPDIYETRLLRQDGSAMDVLMYGTLIEYEGRVATQGAFSDITDRKRAEEAVREREEQFRTLVQYAPEAIVVFDTESGRFVDANENAVRLYGLEREELLKVGPIDMSPPAQPDGRPSAEVAIAHIQKAVEGGVPVFEWTHRNAAGENVPCEIRLVRLPASGRTLIRASITDIADRKRAEAERERFTTQLDTAADVAGQVSAILDPDQLLNAVIPLLHDRFQLYHVHFYGLDAAAGELVLRAGYGEPGRIMLERGHKIPLAREQSLVARAARTKEAVLVNDVTSAPDFLPNPLLPETRSEVAVPAIAGGQVLGVFDVQQNVANYFTEADLDVFTTLTGQIATALQNAGYVELVESRLHVSQTLAGAQTEEQVLDAMIKAADFYPQAQVSIYTLIAGAGELTVTARRVDNFASGLQLAVQPGMAFPASLFTILDLISADKPFISADALTDERIDPASREMMRQTGGVSLAVLPVTAGNEWIGFIAASSPRESYFDERKLYLYNALAEQGAVALRTARLRDQVQESLAETRVRFEVSQALVGAQTEEQVLDVLIQQMGLHSKAQATIFTNELYERELTTVVRRVEFLDSGLASVLEAGMRFPASQFQMVAEHSAGGEFVSPNMPLDERADPSAREMAARMGTVSMAIMPLTAGNEQIGSISLASKEEAYFDEDKLNLYRTLAEQGAVALHTARLYDETQRTSERLKEVDRLKSEFLANMSHELRTPLNSILGYTEVMLMGIDGEMDPETQADVQAIYDNGQHLLHLISDILDLAKIEAGRLNLNFETVDMRPLIDEIVTSTNGLLLKRQKSVEFNVEIAGDLPVAQVDRLRLNQILNNLLSNAVKFTDAGHISLRAVGDGDHICLEVEDTGIGISPADQEKIFDQFRQADGSYKRRAEGTGLGLSITRHLVQMHGGTIAVHSQPGQGSTFTVRLPLKRQTAEQGIEAAAPPTGKGKGRGKGK